MTQGPFLNIFLNHNSSSQLTWPINRYKQGQLFSRIFLIIWMAATKLQILFNLATCSNYSITSYHKIPAFRFLKRWTRYIWKWQMVTIKNGKTLLYCHFNKIKGPGISFQYPVLSQKHVRHICHIAHWYLTKFFDSI